MAYVIKEVETQCPWDDGVVSYAFGDGITEELGKLFVLCMKRWETFLTDDGNSLVKFVDVTKGQRPDAYTVITGVSLKDAATSSGILGSPKKMDNKVVTFKLNTYRADEGKSIPHELAHVLGMAHEHQRNRAAEAQAVNKAEDARLYYLGMPSEEETQVEIPQRKSSGPSKKEQKKYKIVKKTVYKGANLKDDWDRWDKLYVAIGDYDLKSITHYPKVSDWKWNYEPFNKDAALALGALNYPTLEEVQNNTWEPSAKDIAALKQLYKKKQQ